jgi:hypothetical protein
MDSSAKAALSFVISCAISIVIAIIIYSATSSGKNATYKLFYHVAELSKQRHVERWRWTGEDIPSRKWGISVISPNGQLLGTQIIGNLYYHREIEVPWDAENNTIASDPATSNSERFHFAHTVLISRLSPLLYGLVGLGLGWVGAYGIAVRDAVDGYRAPPSFFSECALAGVVPGGALFVLAAILDGGGTAAEYLYYQASLPGWRRALAGSLITYGPLEGHFRMMQTILFDVVPNSVALGRLVSLLCVGIWVVVLSIFLSGLIPLYAFLSYGEHPAHNQIERATRGDDSIPVDGRGLAAMLRNDNPMSDFARKIGIRKLREMVGMVNREDMYLKAKEELARRTAEMEAVRARIEELERERNRS